MISVDIEDTSECKYNFGYLQAVVNRHIRITEVYFNFIIQIYNLIEKCQNLLLTSLSEQIRRRSGQIIVQFLLKYGDEKKLMQIHLNYLIKNMNFVYESGRLSCYDIIHAVVLKFNQTV